MLLQLLPGQYPRGFWEAAAGKAGGGLQGLVPAFPTLPSEVTGGLQQLAGLIGVPELAQVAGWLGGGAEAAVRGAIAAQLAPVVDLARSLDRQIESRVDTIASLIARGQDIYGQWLALATAPDPVAAVRQIIGRHAPALGNLLDLALRMKDDLWSDYQRLTALLDSEQSLLQKLLAARQIVGNRIDQLTGMADRLPGLIAELMEGGGATDTDDDDAGAPTLPPGDGLPDLPAPEPGDSY